MIEKTKEEIVDYAKKLVDDKKTWHFHLLTPDCVFNTKSNFALVLENSTDNEVLVNHSDIKQEEESKAMLELLHGIKADEEQKLSDHVSESVKKMEIRAKGLIKKGILWHHHALFPDCIFNKSKGKWIVMLEDLETREVMESVTDNKPDSDLQVIEPLFYHQKKN